MANQISNVGFLNPDSADMMELERRKAMAQVLQQQSMEPLQAPQGGRFATPISPWQGMAKLVQGASAGIQNARTQEMARALGQKQQDRRGADISLLVNALRGRQASPGGLSEDAAGNVTQMDPMAAQSPMQGLQQALPMLQDPQMQQAGLQAFMQQMPKQPEPFTLSPGATRYGPEGQPLATAPQLPKQPEPFTLSPGATRYGPEGQPIASAPKPQEPFTLAPGAIRYGPDGKPIVESPKEQKPLVTVDMRGENKYAETVGTKSGERDISQHDTATAALENISKLDTVLDHLETSDAITGMGAELFKNLERAKQLVMRDQASGKKVSDTELLDAMLGSDVFPMIKALGIGARGLDTPAEREFLRSVMMGVIPMNKDTLVRMAKLRRDVSERAVKRWNDRIESGELDRYFRAAGMPKQKIELPKVQRSTLSPRTQQLLDQYAPVRR